MNDRHTSLWITVLLGGPIAGLAAGIFWTVFMGLIQGPTIPHWLIPGAFFALFMSVLFAVMYAFLFWPVRREWRVAGDRVARDRLIAETRRLRYALATEDANYFYFRPKPWFRIKPRCSTIEAWLSAESVAIDGPLGVVPTLVKRLSKAARSAEGSSTG